MSENGEAFTNIVGTSFRYDQRALKAISSVSHRSGLRERLSLGGGRVPNVSFFRARLSQYEFAIEFECARLTRDVESPLLWRSRIG